jgi:hypothetical protein
VEIFTITFKHLLEITVYYCISPIVALCSIRTFTNPCQNLPKWEVFTAPSPLYVSFITLCLCNLGPHILVAYGGRLQQKKALSHQSVMSSVYNYIYIYIYIYTSSAWALPQRCSVAGSHFQSNAVATLHLIGKFNKGIREY